MKYTPGPWLAQGRYIGVKGHMSYIGECSDQNGNWTNEPMSVANAHLIAAAPELLEALKKCRVALRGSAGPEEIINARDAAGAAIAKATGGAA
jgi:hypothetical protein